MSATSETLRLIELTSARLCRGIGDPAGPLDGLPEPHAAHRSRLLRAAWGPDDQTLSSAALRSLAAGLPACVSVDLSGLDDACVLPPCRGRIVLNLLLLAADSMPAGGTVMLAGSADDLFVRIDGPAAAWPTAMAVCMVNEAAAHAAISAGKAAQMPLTALLAHAAGVRLSVLMSPAAHTPSAHTPSAHTPSAHTPASIVRLGGG